MGVRGKIAKDKLPIIKAYTEEIKKLSEQVNKFLTDREYAIKMDPGGDWWVADLKDRDWCISPKLKDLETLHAWVRDNNRSIDMRRFRKE